LLTFFTSLGKTASPFFNLFNALTPEVIPLTAGNPSATVIASTISPTNFLPPVFSSKPISLENSPSEKEPFPP